MPKRKYPWEEIEAEVLRTEGSLDYKAIGTKYNIPVPQVTQRSFRCGWKARHEEFLSQLNKERDRLRIEELSARYQRLDTAIFKLGAALLEQLGENLSRAKRENKVLTPGQIKTCAEALYSLHKLFEATKGDVLSCLHKLMEAGILADHAPRILVALEESDHRLQAELSKAFKASE